MADDAIRRQIQLTLEAQGFSASAKEIAALQAHIQKLIKSSSSLGGNYADLVKEIDKAVAAFGQNKRAMDQAARAAQSANAVMEKSFNSLDKGVRSAAQGILGFSTAFGAVSAAKKSLNILESYNKALLSQAGAASRYGLGISALEKRLESVGDTMSLTKMETLELFQAYQKGFGSISLGGFEKMVGNIKNVVGPSKDAIAGMLGELQGALQIIPDMQKSMEDLSASDSNRLRRSADASLAAGKLSMSQYKSLMSYVNGQQQATAADKARQQSIQKQQKVFQEFSRHVERIALYLAEAFMPVFESLAGWLAENKNEIRSFFDGMGSAIQTGVSWVKKMSDAMGGLGGVIKAVAAIWAASKLWTLGGMAIAGGRAVTGLLTSGAGMAAGRGAAALAAGGAAGGGGAAAAAGGGSLISRLFGGGGAASTGFMGGAKRLGGRVLGRGIAGAGIGLATDMGSDYLYSKSREAREAGDTETAGAYKAGGGAVSVAGYAATGAMLGSILPGIGTAVGGIAGAAWGLYKDGGAIFSGVSEMMGYQKGTNDKLKTMSDAERANQKSLEQYIKGRGPEAQAFDQERKLIAQQEAISKHAEGETERVGNRFLSPQEIEQEFAKVSTARQNYERFQNDANTKLQQYNTVAAGQEYAATESGIRNVDVDIKEKSAQLSRAKSAKEAAQEQGDDASVASADAEIQSLGIDLEQLNTAKQTLANIREEVLRTSDAAFEANKAFAGGEAINAAIVEQMEKERKAAESISGFTQANVAQFDILIQRAEMFGDVTANQIRAAQAEVSDAIAMEVEQTQLLLKYQEARAKGIELSGEEQDKLNSIAQKHGKESIGQLDVDKARLDSQNKINTLKIKEMTLSQKVTAAYTAQLNLAGQQTSLMTTSVSLMDNFAIGVGASAEMRQRAVQFAQKEIDIMGQQSAELDKEIAKRRQAGKPVIDLENKRLEIQNKILGKVQQQAQQMKALRDGWIGAIGAMNTGAGRFTKIMLSQDQNLGASLGRFKTVVSSVSGAVTDPSGNAMNSVGYRNSSRFTSSGNLTSQTSFGANAQRDGVAYSTGRNDAPMSVEAVMRGDVQQVAKGIKNSIQDATAKAYAGGAANVLGTAGQAQQSGFAGKSDRRTSGGHVGATTGDDLLNQSNPGPSPAGPPMQGPPVQGPQMPEPMQEDLGRSLKDTNEQIQNAYDNMRKKYSSMTAARRNLRRSGDSAGASALTDDIAEARDKKNAIKGFMDSGIASAMPEWMMNLAGYSAVESPVEKSGTSGFSAGLSSDVEHTGGPVAGAAYTIPAVNVHVAFENLAQLESIIASKIQSAILTEHKRSASGGDISVGIEGGRAVSQLAP